MKTYLFSLLSVFCFLPGTTVYCQTPTIASFSPASGPSGTTVTITGNNFSTTPTNNIVYFGTTRAQVNSATINSLTVSVPSQSGFSPISVTKNGLTGYSSQSYLETFSNNIQAFSNTSFSPPMLFESPGAPGYSSIPTEVSCGDIDGDGKADIIALNSNDTSLNILRNLSTAGMLNFEQHRVFIPNILYFIQAIGDIDGDGKLDIVAVTSIGKKISVLKNSSVPGNISFSGRLDIPTDSSCYGVAIGDIDGDGKPDIVLSEHVLNKISVFRNTSTGGNISFASKIDYTTGTQPYNLIVRDLNNDGKADIVVTNGSASTISVFENKSNPGSISLAQRKDYATGFYPTDVAVADLDSDGKADIVVANYYDHSVSAFHNITKDTLAFDNGKTFYDYASQGNIAVADLNGDGKPDVATVAGDGSTSGGVNITVLRNISTPGTINFAYNISYNVNSSEGIALNDLDGDGKPEIITGSWSGNSITVKRNQINEPYINNVNPSAAGAGAFITISGNNFQNVNAVTFGTVPADSFKVINNDTIIAVVPNELRNDSINLISPAGHVIYTGFTYTGPLISSFYPVQAGKGDTVFISGTNFTNTTLVKFGNTPAASVILVDPEHIKAVLDSGSTGKVYVSNDNGFDEKDSLRFYYQPVITSFSPLTAICGDTITIKGIYFSNASDVSFGDFPAVSYSVINDSIIIAIVGSGGSGNIKIITPGGSAVLSGFIFSGPVISSFSPSAGGSGVKVRISGTGFLNTQQVLFGSVESSFFTVINDSAIDAIVGNGATGPVTVVTTEGTTRRNSFIYGYPLTEELCPPQTTGFFISQTTGSQYQWQKLDINKGLVDITDDSNFYGSKTDTLVFKLTSSQTGSTYVCKVDGVYTYPFKIRFVNNWVGGSDTNWNNPANWSCATVPDENTDVYLYYGAVVLNSNVTVRSLTLYPGVSFTVNAPYKITVTH